MGIASKNGKYHRVAEKTSVFFVQKNLINFYSDFHFSVFQDLEFRKKLPF